MLRPYRSGALRDGSDTQLERQIGSRGQVELFSRALWLKQNDASSAPGAAKPITGASPTPAAANRAFLYGTLT